jgi:hypothetical protein
MKSPLKAKPLHNPGETVDRQRILMILDDVVLYALIAALFVGYAGFEWVRWLTNSPPHPYIFSSLAVLALGFAFWKTRKALVKNTRMKQGRDGEKAVGQFLDRLRESGAQIFHDIPGEGFNLDHVMIHSTGIYVIETKTYSKPDRGKPKLVFDGEKVTRNGHQFRCDPIGQVRGARQWLIELIKESTGKAFPVKAVVVYPGWFIETTGKGNSGDTWVLNPKALPAFVASREKQIRPQDVHLCAAHLSRYVRSVSD